MSSIPGWLSTLLSMTEKTEFVIFGSKHNLSKVTSCQRSLPVKGHFLSKVTSSSFTIGDHVITASAAVKNLGNYFNPEMKMDMQVTKTAKSVWFHLHSIGTIRKYLS